MNGSEYLSDIAVGRLNATSAHSISVVPNPATATSLITVDLPFDDQVILELYSPDGMKAGAYTLKKELNMPLTLRWNQIFKTLGDGLYTVKASGKTEIIYCKVLIFSNK